MIGVIEARKIRELIRGMSSEQQMVVAEELTTDTLFLELIRRDKEKDTIISQVKGAFKVYMGEEK